MRFERKDIERLALKAAATHRVKLAGGLDTRVCPSPDGDGFEVRFKHRACDWYGVLVAKSQPSLQALRDEIDGLARSTAEGPSS